MLKTSGDITKANWPVADLELAATQDVTIAVQVNGKMRGSFNIAKESNKEALLKAALELVTVQRDIGDRPIKKQIVVPNRIVNLVV